MGRMAISFDFDEDDVIDVRELMASIDWASVPPPPPGSGAAITEDGRRLETEEEFYEWLAEVRGRRETS